MLRALCSNRKARSWAGQMMLLGLGIAAILWLIDNTVTNLTARNIRVGFDFLTQTANFPISESLLPYTPEDSFLWAYVVGLGNTLLISLVAIVLATLLGLAVGLARRSKHPMVGGIAGGFVTLMRNMPLIVQLLFWYALATTALPTARAALSPVPGVYLSLRGLYFPSLVFDSRAWALMAAAAVSGVVLFRLAAPLARRSTLPPRHLTLSLWAVWGALLGLLTTALRPQIGWSVPELKGFNFSGGLRLSPEFAALMLGLVIYTSAFIGEIIRGGIDAVGKGQWEAGRALGLSDRQVLNRIILPQALRIIIPPMTTQYLSTVKNSTLALAVGFPELGLVVGTVINQTGQAIESILVLLSVFLTISLGVSFFMNWYNAKAALVTR